MIRRLFIVLFLLVVHLSMSQPLYEHRGVQYATHGTDFWFCLPCTKEGASHNRACLYIMSEHNCTVTIRNELLDFTYTKFITNCHEINSRLDTLNFIDLPDNVINFLDALQPGVSASQQQAARPQARSFHITSTDTICVFAFAYSMGNIDVTNVLPTQMLRDEYVIQAYPDYWGMFQVLATEDNTVVDITLSDYDWLGRPRDSIVTVTLNRGMMYNDMVGEWCIKYPECCTQADTPVHIYGCKSDLEPLMSHMFNYDSNMDESCMFRYPSYAVDLSGTHIKARDNKKIAVFQGNRLCKLGGTMGGDLMFEQAMPIRYAGMEFVVPNLRASKYDFIKFTGLIDGTTITIMNTMDPSLPTRTITADARESKWFLMDTNEGPFYITSTHPILTSVSSCTFEFTPRVPRGDPATVVVVPVEWWHNGPVNGSQVYWIDDNNNAYAYYHSVHIFTRTEDVGGMYFNRVPIDTMFTPIPGTPYSYAYVHYFSPLVTLTRSSHQVENIRGGAFWVLADAEKDSEHALFSYSHLQRGKNYLEVNDVPADSLPADSIWCMYDPIRFHGWVERPADSIIWDFGDGNVERYLYEDGQWVAHTYADTGRFRITRIIQYMDEALDTNWGYVACKSVYTRPSDTMYAHVRVREHVDMDSAVTMCEGTFTFRGQVLETTDTYYIRIPGDSIGCDTLWEIAFVTCPHCSTFSDTILSSMLPWEFNGVTFLQSTRHYPVHIDIGDECDSIIYYDLTVIHHGGGSTPDTVPHQPLDTIFVLAPNVIMPNGDIEANRTFRLFCSKDVVVAEVYIFDRVGRRLAHFNGLTEEWDGTYDGIPCPQAAYAYYVRYIDGSNRNWKTKAGTFTIIR